MEIDVGSLRCMAPSLGIPPSRHYDPSDDEDAALRLDWAKFLFRAGYRLRYPQETTGTAVLLFHRFLIQERVGKHQRSRDVILTTCLFLAGKVTEAPRRLRDVINVLHMLTCTGQDEPPLLDKAYWTMKERIVEFEQVLLRTINFQVDPPDPYRLLLNYARSLRLGRAATRTAWGLANDVLFCPRALSAPPPAVACAAIRMAARVHGADRRLRWFSPPIRKKRRLADDDDRDFLSRGFGDGGRFDDVSGLGPSAGCGGGGGGGGVGGGGGGGGSGAGGGGGGSGGDGGDGGGVEQHVKGEREMGGDGRGGAATAAAAAAAAAPAPAAPAGEGARGATSLPDGGDHDRFVSEREAVTAREGVGLEAGAGGGSRTAVGKSGCSPDLGATEDSSAERKGRQDVVGETAAAAAVCGGDAFVVGGGSAGRGSGGSGGDRGKEDEREVMPWWGLFDARDEEIEMVCSELLALYRAHDANGGSKGIGSRSDGGGGAGRGVTPSRLAGGSAEGHSSAVVVGDRSRSNGLGGGAGGQGIVEEVSSASSADSSRRRNGNRQ